MNKAAQQEKLQVKGFVADIYSFAIASEYDIVLLDSLKRIIKESGVSLEVLTDGYTSYHEYDAEFHMYIIKKS